MHYIVQDSVIELIVLRIQELIQQKCLNDKKRNAVKTCFPSLIFAHSVVKNFYSPD